MKYTSTGLLVFLLGTIACPPSAMAYIGPGGGIGAIGIFLALVIGFVLALLGFVGYPLKRMIKKLRRPPASEQEETTE